jgi:hypothetical protein
MKHIHFVIYRLKSIFIIYLMIFYFHLLTHFFTICIYPEIDFFNPLDDVKIQRKTITFTKHGYTHTVFVNKMINSGIMRMFIFLFIISIFIYCILLAKCYVFAYLILLGLVWEILFFCNDFIFFHLIIWWGIGIASESKLEVLRDSCFRLHNCFYFLLFCLIILFYYYSNIPYSRR